MQLKFPQLATAKTLPSLTVMRSVASAVGASAFFLSVDIVSTPIPMQKNEPRTGAISHHYCGGQSACATVFRRGPLGRLCPGGKPCGAQIRL